MTRKTTGQLPGEIILGTRGSRLAMIQTERVATLLEACNPGLSVQIRPLGTAGDRDRRTPLPEIGGTGVFTADLEAALKRGEIDAAVHSLKDLPVEDGTGLGTGLALGAIPERTDAADALVSRNRIYLANLPAGARIGTSSVRRAAQILAIRPDLVVEPVRGNVETRVRKVMDGLFEATVLAAAGLVRLGMEEEITERFPWSVMLPAPGQGALAVQYHTRTELVGRLLALIDNPGTRAAVTAERAFLHALGGGCSSPVGALGVTHHSDGVIHVKLLGAVLNPDGTGVIRVEAEDTDPVAAGRRAADEALAHGAGDRLRRVTGLRAEPMALRGKRILVTRPEEDAAPLVRLLRNQGARVVSIPMIRIVPELTAEARKARKALEQIDSYDFVVFTSANTVRILLDPDPDHGVDRLPPHDPVFLADLSRRAAAVGPATAGELRNHGVVPSVVPQTHRAEELPAALGDLRGRSILLPQGRAAGTNLAETFRAAGATVHHLVVYRTEPATTAGDHLVAEAILTEPPEIITFTSGSAARAFAAALHRLDLQPGAGPLTDTFVACIGPSTAAAAREAGLPVHLVAAHHTMEGLVDALVTKGGA